MHARVSCTWVTLWNLVWRIVHNDRTAILHREHADRAVKGPLSGCHRRGQPLPVDEVLADCVVPVVLAALMPHVVDSLVIPENDDVSIFALGAQSQHGRIAADSRVQ